MEINEHEKRGIKRIMSVQLVVMAIMITAGGIIYGFNTGEWFIALLVIITILALTLIFAPFVYMAAISRHNSCQHNMVKF